MFFFVSKGYEIASLEKGVMKYSWVCLIMFLKKIREREGVNVCAQMPDIRKKEKGMKTFNHILELFDPDIS